MAPYHPHESDNDVIMRPLESLTEEDLLTLHFTARREMDGSSRLKQHDNVHQQIAAFEKLLQHAINRFSTDKLYQMIHIVLYTLPYIPKPRYMNDFDESSDEISSLSHLREVLVEFKHPDRHGIEKDEQSHVVKYFDTFFEDISYLKSLKYYFDQKVYVCLYEYFYDPEDDMFDPRETLKREKKGRVTFKENERDSGNASQTGSDDDITKRNFLEEMQEEVELEFYFDKLSEQEKLSIAVRKLFQINNRWGELFQEHTIDSRVFDPDSRHEILQFEIYDRFEKVLRLVPDLFVKAYKSVELAKLWWTQANKIYDILPQKQTKKRSEQEINAQVRHLEKKLTNIRNEIKRHEDLLGMQANELENLRDREQRYKSLSEECEQLEVRKNDMGDRYNAILEQRNELKDTLDTMNPYSLQYSEAQHEVKEWERKFFDAQVELRMLTFQFQLIQSDFLMELDLRPDLIRFQVDIESKMTDTRQAIWGKGEEVRDSEKRLTLLKTNCERMRIVMRKILLNNDEEESGKDDHKKFKKKAGDDRNEHKRNDQKKETLEKINHHVVGEEHDERRKQTTNKQTRQQKGNQVEVRKDQKHNPRQTDDQKSRTQNDRKAARDGGRYEDRSDWLREDENKQKKEKSTDCDSR